MIRIISLCFCIIYCVCINGQNREYFFGYSESKPCLFYGNKFLIPLSKYPVNSECIIGDFGQKASYLCLNELIAVHINI